MRLGSETWILGTLLAVFVVATVTFTRHSYEAEADEHPSTYGTSSKGLKAIYELLGRRHVQVDRYQKSFDDIPDDAGLLIVSEPLVRPIGDDEQNGLLDWVQDGGAVAVIVSGSWPLRGMSGVTFNQLGVTDTGPPTGVATNRTDPPVGYAADIAELRLTTSTRLVNDAEWKQTTVFADDAGACVVSWSVGEGTVIAISDAVAPRNAALADSDTGLLFLNIAAAHANGARPHVLFDEYHQGHGRATSDRPTLWSAMGTPLRTGFWIAVGLMAIAIVSANRRFGRPTVLNRRASRPSTEYVDSMADLYRRAGASGIAVELLYRPFARDLAHRVDAPPDATSQDVARLAEARFGLPRSVLEHMMERCESIAGGENVTEPEMLRLAQQMDDYRRRADLVRLSRRSVDDRRG